MKKIKILEQNVWKKIRAGEIVEDHSSIIRELIDNSYDANAKNIKVILYKSGLQKLIVVDDGEGIDKEDLPLVHLNHSTSKIENENDLNYIKTLGFRGEALFAISNVSKFIIKSKPSYQDIGYILEIEGGNKINFSPVPMNNGTQVEVSELFYNTPARKKFLPNQATIYKKIKDIFNKKALACFDSNFFLINDNKEILSYSYNNFFDRLKEIYGEIVYDNLLMIKIEAHENKINEENNKKNENDKNKKIFESNKNINNEKTFCIKEIVNNKKFKNKSILNKKISDIIFENFINNFKVSKFFIGFSDKDFFSKYSSTIIIIINKRPVSFELLEKRIRSFYYSFLPRGFYPYFFLYIEIDPQLLDQNVDPTKSRVKLKDEKIFCDFIENLLFNLLSDSLNLNNLNNFNTQNIKDNIINNNLRDTNIEKSNIFEYVNIENKNNSITLVEENNFGYIDSFEKDKNTKDVIHDINLNINLNTNILNDNFFGKFIGYIFETYLVFEKYSPFGNKEDKLYFIDFHAAYEVCNFRILQEKKIKRRSLLFPKQLKIKEEILDKMDKAFEDSNKNIILNLLNEIGFSFERIKRDTLLITEIPNIIDDEKIDSILIDIENFIEENENYNFYENSSLNKNNLIIFEKLKEKIYSQIACKISPKANEKLSIIDIKNLLNLMRKFNYPASCPHGRPTYIEINKNFLDKKFMRV